jgi:putative ABC transport system permease protein
MVDVALALILVAIAVVLSRMNSLSLERDILVGTARAFLQLMAIGYLLNFLFDLRRLELVILLLVVMILVGGHTSSRRAKALRGGFLLAAGSIGLGTFVTLGLLIGLGIITTEPRYLIPLAGMTIGNATRTCSLALERLRAELSSRSREVEAALALGATSRQAAQHIVRAAVRAAMVPLVDTLKIVGLIQFPGAMTGMILAGARPLDAVRIQLIVMYMLVAAALIASISIALLALRRSFTRGHQLVFPQGRQLF